MKVVDFINRLKELGYNDDTEISFGFPDSNGEWFDFEVKEIEDDDREVDVDNIGVVFKPNEKYNASILQEANNDLEEDLKILIQKYCK